MTVHAMLPDSCSTSQAAKCLKVAPSTIQAWVEAGYLDAWKTPGGHRRIALASIRKLLQDGGPQPLPRVLIVEDDPQARDIYAAYFDRWKLPVTLVLIDNGYDALLSVAEQRPELLITDLLMPGMDGFKMISSLRKNPKTAGLHIVAITGMSVEEVADRGGLPVGTKVLHKPIQPDELRALVAGCLEIERTAAAL